MRTTRDFMPTTLSALTLAILVAATGCRSGFESNPEDGFIADVRPDGGTDGGTDALDAGADVREDTGGPGDAVSPDALAVCGNGAVEPGEGCDDANNDASDGCNACVVTEGWRCDSAPSVCAIACGDGLVVGSETCDDGGTLSGDGCSETCQEETGWSCAPSSPTTCAPDCGDGLIVGDEGCDDGQGVGLTTSGDGCSADCTTEPGWACEGVPSTCKESCGDGILEPAAGEECDDSNLTLGDGCDASCKAEAGWKCDANGCTNDCGDGLWIPVVEGCDGGPEGVVGCNADCSVQDGYLCAGQPGALSVCGPDCGDGIVLGAEECDDGNDASGDGCSGACVVEPGYDCDQAAGGPSICVKCGDGLVTGAEVCDDGNKVSGDGCDTTCKEEEGWNCQTNPNGGSVCEPICGDGKTLGDEQCDDAGSDGVDGCTDCVADEGWNCTVNASTLSSTCEVICGDGLLVGSELGANGCDDGNSIADDGCSGCVVDPKWNCSGAPSACCYDPDGDGYGPDAACLGPDCNNEDSDVNPTATEACDGIDNDCDGVTDDVTEPCYEGPPGTEGEGACSGGERVCIDGQLTECLGQTLPAVEVCGGADDDCDGAIDEEIGEFVCGPQHCSTNVPACGTGGATAACLEVPDQAETCGDGIDNDCDGVVDNDCGCVWVHDLGGFLGEQGTLGNPFKTIQAAIDHAALEEKPLVCVMGGCVLETVYDGPITMANGVSVQGGYDPITNFFAPGSCRPTITSGAPATVTFPTAVSSPTTLTDVEVKNTANQANGVARTIAVQGAAGAILKDVIVVGNQKEGFGIVHGVEVSSEGAAEASLQVFGGAIYGSSVAETLSTGIHVDGGTLVMKVCGGLSFAEGCESGEGALVTNLSPNLAPPDILVSGRAVVLKNASGSRIDQSFMVAGAALDAVAVEVTGKSEDITISRSSLEGLSSDGYSGGVRASNCLDSAVSLVDNYSVTSGGGGELSVGVEVNGCSMAISGNQLIAGSALGDGDVDQSVGVYCHGDSLCSIADNEEIRGSVVPVGGEAVGVRCQGEACPSVRNNTIRGGDGKHSVGLWFQGAQYSRVERNELIGGCSSSKDGTMMGARLSQSSVRLESNFIRSGGCPGDEERTFVALAVEYAENSSLHPDIHSNTLRVGGDNGATCHSFGLLLDGAIADTTEPRGLFRNNLVFGGLCPWGAPVAEINDASPGVFEHNHLVAGLLPDLYWEGWEESQPGPENAWTTVEEVDEQNGGKGTQTGDPLVDFDTPPYTLQSSSPLIGAGTPDGAPEDDYWGESRAVPPTIGCIEQ